MEINRKILFLSELLLLSLFCTFSCYSQTVEQQLHKVNFIYPGYEMEFRIAERITLGIKGEARIWGFYMGKYSTIFGSDEPSWAWQLVPALESNLRYYHNIASRAEKGKKTLNNSANYLNLGFYALQPAIDIAVKNSVPENDFMYGPFAGYGLRRTFRNDRLIFDANCRLQFNNSKQDRFKPMLVPVLSLGYRLNQK